MAKTISSAQELMQGRELQFQVTLQFNDRVFGGLPKNPDTIRSFIEARSNQGKLPVNLAPEDREGLAKEIEQMTSGLVVAEEGPAVTDAEACMTTFARDETGLYLEGRCLKALLKECASILGKGWDVSAAKARVAERVFVVEPCIYLTRDGVILREPDGQHCAAIHVQTAMGPRSALKLADYAERARISFTVTALNEPLVTKVEKNKITVPAYLEALLSYGQQLGVGKDRSQGAGTYTVVEFKPID